MAKIKLLLKWVYGIGFTIAGLILMFSTSFVGGLLFIIGGIILFPPTLKIIEEKIGAPLNRTVKYITIIVIQFVGIIFIASNQVDKEDVKKKKEQEAFDKLPKQVKDSINLVKAKQDSVDNIQKEQERIAEEIENRKEDLEKQFSPYDGSHNGLTELIKKNMPDPESYEHVETRFSDKGDHIFVVTKFRGKNGFGGYVFQTVSANVDFKGNVIEILSQK